MIVPDQVLTSIEAMEMDQLLPPINPFIWYKKEVKCRHHHRCRNAIDRQDKNCLPQWQFQHL